MRSRRRRGMTLIEVMLAIAIIATLTAILGAGALRIYQQSQVQVTELTLQTTQQEVLVYEARRRRLPETAEGLSVVYGSDDVPVDAWQQPIRYERTQRFDLVSTGSDGVEGGRGRAADLRLSAP